MTRIDPASGREIHSRWSTLIFISTPGYFLAGPSVALNFTLGIVTLLVVAALYVRAEPEPKDSST